MGHSANCSVCLSASIINNTTIHVQCFKYTALGILVGRAAMVKKVALKIHKNAFFNVLICEGELKVKCACIFWASKLIMVL